MNVSSQACIIFRLRYTGRWSHGGRAEREMDCSADKVGPTVKGRNPHRRTSWKLVLVRNPGFQLVSSYSPVWVAALTE